ncbi:MAG: AAA family ATPase [Firmicutes bacterium]|nr:AAA family ATPase [Bacillota bacterium]
MIPIELRLSGVRAFGNHTISLGSHDVREVIMFGANGSGKSTIARMIQALVGDLPDDLYQGYLDERDARVNRRATAELTVLNPKGDMWNPDWPDTVALGLEFGYDNTRPFSRFYTVADGRRQNYRSHEEYAEIFRRTYSIKPDDRFMFIQQGESAALVQMKPRSRYETMKQFLGLEDLEKRWQETLDARNRAFEELRNAQNQRDILYDGLKRKEIAWKQLSEFRRLSQELAEIQQVVARDNLVRHVIALDKAVADEEALSKTLAQELARQSVLETDLQKYADGIARYRDESAKLTTSIEQAREVHRAANEERQRYRKDAEELAEQVESIERVVAEGLSGEELEARIAGLEQKIGDLERAIADGRGQEQTLETLLSLRQSDLAALRGELERMKRELAEAEQALLRYGDPAALEEALGGLSTGLRNARQAAVLAEEKSRLANEHLELLKQSRTATPPSATTAASEYRDAGSAAAVLCECVIPREGASLEERRLLEGALGDLRVAVLVEDGRVLVGYTEYTIADFPGGAAPVEGSRRTVRESLIPAAKLPASLSALLDRVLESVVFAAGHAEAGALAAQGFVAYTPDGYRYDRYGRRHSVPAEFCLGPQAYEMALEKASEAARLAAQDSQEKADALRQVEDNVRSLESALKAARDAARLSARLRLSIPESTARADNLSAEVDTLSAQMRGLRRQITGNEIARAVSTRDLEAARTSLERWKKSADLPLLKQRLSDAREAEARARKAADGALEDTRRLELAIDATAREIDRLERSTEIGRARLSDAIQRLAEMEERLSERRLSLRDLQSRTGGIVDEWRRVFARPDTTDEQALQEGRSVAASTPPASDERRVEWHRRQVEIAPTVETLRSDVIPTAGEDYASAKEQFEKAQYELDRVKTAYDDAASKESAAQENFKKVMLDTFHRISGRFSRYMEQFGWTGFLQVEPVQGTQFELHIYVSVYQGVEPRPLLRNRSGGETSAIAALLTLAMVKEYRRPFYIFDEIDQSLDPANVLKIASLLRQELDRKYILISHRLNKAHLEQGQFGIGVYRSQEEGSKTRVYRRKEWPVASS